MAEKLFAGCDLGDRYSHVCVLDERGNVVDRVRLKTTHEALAGWFNGRRMRVIIEVGPHSRWVNELLLQCGQEVIIANPRNVKLIAQSQRKTDKRDAELLARLGRADPALLAPIHHRSMAAQADLVAIRTRDLLVRERTRLVTHIRGVCGSFGAPLPACYPEAFAKKAAPFIPERLHSALSPVLRSLECVVEQIKDLERHIAQLARERYPETARLEQVAGVGIITSLAFVLTLEDPSRFAKSRAVGAFIGLAAAKSQSGDRDPEKHVTKAGDRLLRRLLVNCAQYILARGPESDLRRWGRELAQRGKQNAKKRAVVAVARKLAVLLHHLWATGERYEPIRARLPAAA